MRVAALLALFAATLPAVGAYRLETVAEGLAHPWCIAFLDNGTMLVTERSGNLRLVRDGALVAEPVAGVPAVYARSQGGLFDVAPHPRFAENRLLYLSYAHGTPDANATRLARARFDGERLTDVTPIFTVTPKDTPHHYGGRLMFLPDGTLLLTTGDRRRRRAAQRLDNLLGKVVRLNDDGSVPSDNPFVADDDALDAIFTYGHRNPQGLAFDAASGAIYLHEHGARGGDELNVLAAGANYGWPVATHGLDYSGALITPYKAYPGTVQPLIHWTPSIAPAGMALYDGEAFPEWRGDLFVTSLAFKNVERLDLEDGAVKARTPMFQELDERIRDVRQGPNGHLFILTDSPQGRLVRVVPG